MSDTIILDGGSVKYDLDAARIPIDDLISALTEAKANGAEYVVQDSGNWRGAKWQSISDYYEWHEED